MHEQPKPMIVPHILLCEHAEQLHLGSSGGRSKLGEPAVLGVDTRSEGEDGEVVGGEDDGRRGGEVEVAVAVVIAIVVDIVLVVVVVVVGVVVVV